MIKNKKNQILPEHKLFLGLFLAFEKLLKKMLVPLFQRKKLTPSFFREFKKQEEAFSLSDLAEKKLVLLQLDRLLEKALESLGIEGSGLGEKLKAARGFIDNQEVYSAAWRAHKLRNRLAHGEETKEEELQAAFRDFQRVFYNLFSR
jgi:hypothetical protein